MLRPGQRLIALHIHVNISLDYLRDFVDPLGAAAMCRRRQPTRPAILAADDCDLFGIRSDDDIL